MSSRPEGGKREREREKVMDLRNGFRINLDMKDRDWKCYDFAGLH
jgi:hypothetical protein